MAGVLFIINVPQKEHEVVLRKEFVEKVKTCNLKKNGTTQWYAQDNVNIISKSKSADFLNSNKSALKKTKSEITLNLNEYIDGGKNYVKSSWDDVKQVLNLKRNKLNITGKTRGTDLLAAFHWDTPLETILAEVVARLAVKNSTWNTTRNNQCWQVTFSLESGSLCEELLQVLRTFGIGTKHGSSVCMVPCALYYKSDHGPFRNTDAEDYEHSERNSAWSRFASSVRARSNLAQVLHDVRTNATLTFDWVFLLVAAAFVAAVGLMENSTVILVASMLISPLMAPITAGTLGTAVRDRSLQHMGLIHEIMGVSICLSVGFIVGLCICAVDGRYGVVDDWPTSEMMARCELRSLFIGMLIAMPSGACVALAVLSDYTSSLVGVAISASLLPPAVNAGLLWAMSVYRLAVNEADVNWVVVEPKELAVLGSSSLCLTLINIFCIFLSGVTVYKVKEVCPLERRDITWWRGNKNRLQTLNQGCNDGPPSWEIYSQWCNDTEEADPKAPAERIQSDVVTFRRQNGMQRKRAQSIAESFRRTQLDENQPLELSSQRTKIQPENQEKSTNYNQNIFEYYNFGYDNQESQMHPTVEPSLSFTVEPKRNS